MTGVLLQVGISSKLRKPFVTMGTVENVRVLGKCMKLTKISQPFTLKENIIHFPLKPCSILMINCYCKSLLFQLFSVDQSNRGAACFFGPTPTEPKSLNQPTHDAQTSESPQEELTEPVPNKRMKNTSSTQLTESVALLGNPDNESSTIPLPANNYNDWIKVPSRSKFSKLR